MYPRDKPGWQTTEWWITLFTQVLGMAVMFGVINQTDAQDLQVSVAKLVGAVFVVVAQVSTVVVYVRNRTAHKVAYTEALAAIECAKVEAKVESEPSQVTGHRN